MLMAKLIKGYYKDGVWHEYGGKLYDTIGYNTNGSMTQKAITDTLGSVMEVVSGYSMVVRVHGDTSCSNLAPFYFVVDGDAFTMTITYNQPAIALNLSIIMGNTDITQEAYQDGVISIDRVTGNVVITVETASVTDTNMFTRRTTANGISILNNKALLKGIRGNSLIWNAIRDGNWINTGPTTIAGITYQIVNKNITINGTSTQSGTYSQPTFSTYSNCKGHKLLILNKTNNNPNNNVYFATYGFSIYAEFSDSRILTVTSQTAKLYLRYKTDLGRTYNNAYLACPIAIDLTRMFGAGNEPTTVNAFKKLFPFDLEDYSNSGIVLNNSMTNYISKDGNEETLQNVSLNVPTLTGKLNGEGESVVVFPDGMKSSCNEAVNDTYDEIKQVDGVWKAIKRIGTERATSAISGRGEYEILAEEEVYILDDQTIPTEITVADQGVEEILPTNGATPTTAPAIVEIQYGSIPSRGLLVGLLGGTKGGGSDEPDYSDGEEITDYEEEEEPNEEEPLEEPLDEEPKEDIKESPVIDEKQELKK